jgi:hypothetical protein
MPTVTNKQLESTYGFKSTGFSVDNAGNITALSLVQTGLVSEEVIDGSTPANYTITENGSNTAYIWGPGVSENPTVVLSRSSSYIIDLTSLTNGLYFYNGATQFSTGLTHTDGSNGDTAQGKTSGRLVWNVPLTTPDTITYRNLSGTISGTISITDPIGQFDTVTINNSTISTNSTTGALIVTGGAGIALNSNFGADVGVVGTLTVPTINSLTSLALKVAGTTVGTLTATGMADMAINNSSINNSIIGATTPTTASFTSAIIANAPTTKTSGTNKKYVDDTALALSIALGI